MKKLFFSMLTLVTFAFMSFTNISNTNKTANILRNQETSIDVERCVRECTYLVNTRTGERRLKGCTDWTCDGGSLDEVIIRA
ncbi:hypothetical protein DUT90_03220 [Polaribacter sp. WD7]|uniref:hypothetical protein n=1 Tax=Polaribacter sp. WD7 TaxID=2269061 RepID=UPI000DF2497C|nr:hypothetical protein [Polaribacter sp. WD7]RCS27864.1 hypothetical protein DUT90_03220 [Polaribacter sp. WD7]